ncbi:MAG TPA: transglycosylase family protein [Microthrixaceae bacterium]|jgi:hypothetical protein|nr:transglycosylase family protein [Microthrixaceae bacterium]
MDFGLRNTHRRRALCAVLVLGLAPVSAAAAGDTPAAPSIPSVAVAHADVLRSEQHLIEVTGTLDAARLELDSLNTRSAELVDQIAAARAELRDRAVGAFVSSEEQDETVLYLVGGQDLFESSARIRMMTHSAEVSSAAFRHYNDLKASVDPKVVELGERIQQLEQDVADANDAALAARAIEAEAERQAEQRARAERAARAAAEAAAAAARSTTIPTTVPAATVVADRAPSEPAPAAAAPAAAPTAAPVPLATVPLPAVPAGGPSEAQWAALRNCESSGNYRAVSSSGKYRGAYQFDYRTWAGLGGTGDPAAAPPAEQDARAKLLYSQRGWRPWPVCGRFLR